MYTCVCREDEVCKAVYVGRSCVFGENEVRKAVYLGRIEVCEAVYLGGELRCVKLCMLYTPPYTPGILTFFT